MSTPGSVSVGVVGAGMMGSVHCRLLARSVSGAELAAVADEDPRRASAAAGEAGEARVHEDPYELIADPRVDAVVIASSDATHRDLVLACLRAGKPVLCEKPLAPTTGEARTVVEAEAALGRSLVQVGFMRRFDPGYAALRDALRSGGVGLPLMVHCAHRNAGVPEGYTSEMLMTSSVTHEIDVARWLLDSEIVAATVHSPRASRLAPAGLRDPQLVVLETEDGVLVDVEIFVNARYGYDIRCEVVGESGTLTLPAPPAVETRASGALRSDVDEDYRGRFDAAYRVQMQAWVDALRGRGERGPTAWDGYVAAAVADACVASLRSGRREEVAVGARPGLYAAGERFIAGAA